MKHILLAGLLLPLAACSSTPAPQAPISAAAAAGDYQNMSCAELAAVQREQSANAAWARRQQQQTFGGGTDSNVSISFPTSGGGGPSLGPSASRATPDRATIRQAMTAKGCS